MSCQHRVGPHQSHGVGAQGEAQIAVVVEHVVGDVGGGEVNGCLVIGFADVGVRFRWFLPAGDLVPGSRRILQSHRRPDTGHLPVSLVAVTQERLQRACPGQKTQVLRAQGRAPGQVGFIAERRSGFDAKASFLAQALHQAQAEPQSRLTIVGSRAVGRDGLLTRLAARLLRDQPVVPGAFLHVHRQHLDAVAARVLDQLGR